MRLGQIASSVAVTAVLAGGVVLVANLGHQTRPPRIADATVLAHAATTQARPATTSPAPASRTPSTSERARPRSAAARATRSRTAPATSARPVASHATTAPAARPVTTTPKARPTKRPAARPAPSSRPAAPRHTPAAQPRGGSLPLSFSTGSATKVLTVVASSTSRTTATLQAWQRAAGGGWLRHGSAVTAHVGSEGLTRYPSESRSATPIGSFTLTQAFGRESDPGTGLPYFHTTPADWWISQAGSLYNTHQHCSSGCAFTQGSPNEHLYYETPYYDYAVVIDYNTRNAPGGVRQGAGSAFFLHVTDGAPTAGCVAIPRDQLVSIMRWLGPAADPRILIGTTS